MQRIFDKVIPIGQLNPVLFDRNKRRLDITFSVQRVQDTIADAEVFCLDHDANIPRTGNIKLFSTASGGESVVALIVNGELIEHELTRETGKFTEHSYHIVGSPVFAPTPGVDKLLLETGDFILLETGDKILLEV
jgi:hypothetical protein